MLQRLQSTGHDVLEAPHVPAPKFASPHKSLAVLVERQVAPHALLALTTFAVSLLTVMLFVSVSVCARV